MEKLTDNILSFSQGSFAGNHQAQENTASELLHYVFTPRVFVAVCRGYWDRMGQGVLHFLENRKNRLWYKGSYFALLILEDIFASQMQKLQGHALQEKDVDPPEQILTC